MNQRKQIAEKLQLYVNWKEGEYAPYPKKEFIEILKSAINELNKTCSTCKFFDNGCKFFEYFVDENDYCINHNE